MKKLLLLLFLTPLGFGQAVRYNGDVYTINASAPLPGALYPVLASTSATINICTAPATGFTVLNAATQSISNGCTNYATTYNNAAQSSVCAPPTQLTRTSSTTCVKTVDAEGGFGVWLLSGTYQYTITLSYGSFGPYDFSVGGGGGGPPPPSNCGSLVGDVTSTNCGFGNLVGNTAMKVSTFGFTNVIGNNQSTSQTAVGTNNINRDQGEENIAVGDSNLNNTQNSSTSNGNNIAIGQQNGTEYYGTTAICLGFQNCDSGGNTSGGNALFDVVGIGSGSADNLGLGGFSIIGIGKNAVQNGVGYTGDMLEMICMGDQACFNPFFTAAQEADDIIGLGDSAASGFGAGSSDIVAIGDGADKQCIHAPCTPLPVPAQVLSLVAIGDTAASYNQGSSVVAVGSGALGSNTTGAGMGFYNQGNFNTAVGVNALVGNSTGAHNTAIGNLAGADGFVVPATFGNSNHTGSNNTWVGDDSGPNTTTQLSNTAAFGYHAHNTASNQIVLGNSTMTQAFLFGTGDGCLSSSSGLVTGSGVACGSGGGGSAFSALTGSTNTTATMVVGSGATLSTTGTGTIAATSVGGITITGTPSVGQVPTATSSSAATWQNASTTPAFSAITSGTNTGAAMLVGTGASLGVTGAGTIAATSAVALAAVPSVCSTGQYASGVDINGDAICVPLPTQPASQYIAPQAMSGCGVEYVTGLQYTIGACTYSINGVIYDSPLTNVTLAAADPSNPRIDVIFVDTTQTVQTITGVPAVSPQQPVVDPSTQLELTFVLVPAASTTPGNTTLVDIYLEGVEWTGAKGGTNGTRVNLTSTSNPYSGTHDTEFGVGGTVTTTTFAGYTVPSAGTVDLSNYNTLTLYARNKATWPSTRSITVQWFNGSTAKGTAVVVSNGAFGFDAVTNVSSYQQISIPTSIFGIAGVPVTSVRFTVSGTGAALTGFYLDQITLQGGSGGPSLPATLMNFKGPWSSTATYNPNDTVTSGGVGYVALTTNTNQVVSNVAFWTPLGGSGGGSGISSFTANPSFWPSWLIPTVTGGSGPATSLTVGAGIVPVANGGNGTSTPSLLAGTNVTITGTWPNQTINSTGGGGGGNTTSTSLTNNHLPKANGVNSIIDSGAVDNGSSLTYTGSGTVNSFSLTEGTADTPVAGQDILNANSSTHTLNLSLNGGAFAPLGGASNPTTCSVQTANAICATLAPYNASGAGATTTSAASITSSSTSTTVGSCSTFNAGNGILIPGAGTAGANFIAPLVSCVGTTMTWTGATVTTVTSVTIQHDESTALQAAITALTSTGGTIYIPDGLYLVNGPLQDTGGANAVLQMPKIVYETSPPVSITITGFTQPAGNINTNFGSVLQTSQNTGNFIGGYDAASSTFGPITNVVLEIDKLTLRGPSNPGVVMVNANYIGAFHGYHVRFDTPSNALGANTAGTALITPTISNDVSLNLDDLRESGYYVGYVLGEHTHAGAIYGSNSHDPFVFDSRGSVSISNGISVDYLWEQGSVCGVSAGTQPTVINVQMADIENFTGNGLCDASNRLFGMLNWHVPNKAVLSPSGGANLQYNAMGYGDLIIAPNTASSTVNGTVDFGANFGADAVILFNGGASNTYGWGLNAGEMQFHIASSPTTNHFSWNGGGGLNPVGTNELMRLFATGDLSIGTTTDCSALLGIGSGCHFTVDSSGNAKAASLLATGNVDGTAPVTITTGTTATLGGTFKSGYTLNQEATAATAVAYTLPTAAAGLQYCVGNSWNGSAATTGVLTVNASASGQFIIFTDGTLSATGGNVTSAGAAADAACFVGVDSTHWQMYTQRGTWTKH